MPTLTPVKLKGQVFLDPPQCPQCVYLGSYKGIYSANLGFPFDFYWHNDDSRHTAHAWNGGAGPGLICQYGEGPYSAIAGDVAWQEGNRSTYSFVGFGFDLAKERSLYTGSPPIEVPASEASDSSESSDEDFEGVSVYRVYYTESMTREGYIEVLAHDEREAYRAFRSPPDYNDIDWGDWSGGGDIDSQGYATEERAVGDEDGDEDLPRAY